MVFPQSIPDQVQLPLRVAVGVVAQGIRIRLGRSLVTLTGVALGIAFLMSVLTMQALKRAAATEDALRESASRMYGALVAESGSIYGRPLALVVTEGLSGEESRLLARFVREGAGELRVWAKGAPLPRNAIQSRKLRPVSDENVFGRDASALIVLGTGPLPDLDWQLALRVAHQNLLAFTAARQSRPALAPGGNTIELARPLPPDQRARVALAAKRERFRGLWIIAISLVVTVIGISNAMLMSVTERFRDIGTMKCLGATSSFIHRLFLLEASFTGALGGALGVVGGAGFASVSYLFLYGPSLLGHALVGELGSLCAAAALSLGSGIVLSIVAAIYPAHFAARMLPAAALRTNV
jgi:hypothetical protein